MQDRFAEQMANLEAMEDKMVVSEMGVTWSPNTAPLRIEAMVLCMRSSSLGAAWKMDLVAMGNMMDTAHTHTVLVGPVPACITFLNTEQN